MTLSAWTTDALTRTFPHDLPSRARPLHLFAARGERVAFQIALRHSDRVPQTFSLTAASSADLPITIRTEGLVPVPHTNTDTPESESDLAGRAPCFIPDPLLPTASVLVPGNTTQVFWISTQLPSELPPGTYDIQLDLHLANAVIRTLHVKLTASDVQLQPRRGLIVTHWFYADALCDWYRIRPFDKPFWPIFDAYLANYVAHGNNALYVPAFTPPLDGVKRPTQLLRVSRTSRQYQFDWSDVRQWVTRARKAGIDYLEWSHLFTQWGCAHAIRIYEGDPNQEKLLWSPDTPATSRTYRQFLAQFLPQLHTFLQREKLLDKSLFHISDEPMLQHRDNYRAARHMLQDLAPWIKVMDAISDVQFATEKLIDTPIASISHIPEFLAHHIDAWAYFCCGPRGRYLNRLLDTPLPKLAMAGWLLYRLRLKGFLHWGYNYWYRRQSRDLIDPFQTNDALAWPDWAHGDPFVVYPGTNGPIDSLRWELFAQSLQDYQLLQTLNIAPTSLLLRDLCDFADFPKSSTWLQATRRHLLARSTSRQ